MKLKESDLLTGQEFKQISDILVGALKRREVTLKNVKTIITKEMTNWLLRILDNVEDEYIGDVL